MDRLANLISAQLPKPKPTTTLRSERDELIGRFFDKKAIRIHDPKTKALRLATAAEIALILRHCPTKDLYAFFRECEGARSFSKFFWWGVKRRTNRAA